MEKPFGKRFFWVNFLFFLLPACRRKIFLNRTNVPAATEAVEKLNKKNMQRYELDIVGIECRQCIRTILQILRESNLVAYAECRCVGDDYAHAKIFCYLKKEQKNFPVASVQDILEHSDFILRDITGNFFGDVTQSSDKLLFVLPYYSYLLSIISNQGNQYLVQSLKAAQGVWLFGRLQLIKKVFVPLNRT